MNKGLFRACRWLTSWAAFATLVVHYHTIQPLSAQQPNPVSGEVTCSDCVISLDTILTIGGLDGPGLHVLSYFSRAAVDHRGRILIVDPSQEPEFSVFDSTGAFIRSVGRFGPGPGEYEGISHINVGPRYIHVFDYDRGRTMLDRDFEVIRTDRFPGQVLSSVVTTEDDVIFMGDVGTPTSAGHKVHILRASGELESFGGDNSSMWRAGSPTQHLTGDERTLWAIQARSNRLRLWSLVPRVAPGKVVDRAVEEFDRDNPATVSFPRSTNRGAMLDDKGLWIVWQSPDPEWTERQTQGGLPTEPWNVILDSWIDLVDPESGTTLARYHTDGLLLGFVEGSRYLLGYHGTDAGVPYVHLLRLELTRAYVPARIGPGP